MSDQLLIILEQMKTSWEWLEEKENKYLEKIKEINPLEMSPMDALNFLYRLKEEMKKDEWKNLY